LDAAEGVRGARALNLQDLFGRFPRLFWVVNAIELFERGAYYGMLAVLPYHLVYNLHFPTTAFGLLLGILTPFLYLLPIISGALVEKYGFRPMLVLALSLVIFGYLASSFMTTFEAFVLAFVVFGTGVGTFKPIISASIAHTTKPEARNLGYSIYYWMINLGSFSMPIIISVFIPKQDYVYVFYLSAALIAVNIALALFVFKNPVPPNPQKSVADIFKGAAFVLKDFRFMALLLIYSGFWFMYATNHLALLLYALDFGVLGDWFPPALVAIVNPGTIILLGPFLGKLFGKYDSLKVMVLGMGIFIAGLLVLGLTTIATVFFVGIIIFSIGEFVTHPTYIAYVSKIAPKERLTVYMAYAFIPPLIGLSAGNILGGVAYAAMAEEMHRPKLFWGAISAVGLVTIALLLLYSQTMGAKRQQKALASTGPSQPYPAPPGVQESIAIPAPADPAGIPVGHPAWESRLPVLATLLLVPGLLFGAFAGGTDGFLRGGGGGTGGGWDSYTLTAGSQELSGNAQENLESVHTVELSELNLVCATFTLRWTDEPDMQRLLRTYENQPDQFGLSVAPPNGTAVEARPVANVRGQPGEVSVTIEFAPARPGDRKGTGAYEVTVVCGACGDFTHPVSLVAYTDAGNAWALEVSYQYYAKK
jgi:dipeptide/tripeptide permease